MTRAARVRKHSGRHMNNFMKGPLDIRQMVFDVMFALLSS